LANDSGRSGVPRSLAKDLGPRRSLAKTDLVESYEDLVQEVLGQGIVEVLGQNGWGGKWKSYFMFHYVARATGASPRSLAKDSGRRSIPRSLATDVAWPRRSVAKDLGEFYGDFAREVIGQGPPESLAKGRDVLRSLAKDLGPGGPWPRRGVLFYHLARAIGVSPRSVAKDSGRRVVPRSAAKDRSWPPEVLGQRPGGVVRGHCARGLWLRTSRGPWPRTSRGPWPRRGG
jgi:hypothetical protein